MTATTLIAGYAALVATASLLWQVYLQRQRHRTQVRVELSPVLLHGQPVIDVKLINTSSHSVEWVSVWLESIPADWSAHPEKFEGGSGLPYPVESMQAEHVFFTEQCLDSQIPSPTDQFVAGVRLSTGHEFRSAPNVIRMP